LAIIFNTSLALVILCCEIFLFFLDLFSAWFGPSILMGHRFFANFFSAFFQAANPQKNRQEA